MIIYHNEKDGRVTGLKL